VSSRAFYVASGLQPVFALYDEPHATSEQAPASVLLCPLFGNDELCSYRARRAWALSLANAGHAVLRIDLPGTGDSPGGPHDPALLDAWLESLASAAAWLKRERASARVVAIGIDLGGVLAYRAAAGGAAIDDLVLWSVPSRGRALVRQKRALAQMEAAAEQPGDGSAPAPAPAAADGSLASAGFLLSGETVASLEALDLAALALPAGAERRLLLLQRDGVEVDKRLRSAVEAAGAETEVLPGPGYGAMVAPPQESFAPLQVFATVERWLAQAAPSAPPVEDAAAAQVARRGDTGELEIAVGAGKVRERPVRIAFEDGKLFGVLCEPLEPSSPSELCAVLLNAGALRHVGPGRMWVEIARRWAARGVPTLRIDFSGIGDAEGPIEAMRDNGDFYVERAERESQAMLAALAELGLPQRVVLGGLCSGAYWALHAGAQDDRVVGSFLVNPRVLVWDAALASVRDARNLHKALKAGTWKKLAGGQITRQRVRDVAAGAAVSLRRLPARHRQIAREKNILEQSLAKMQASHAEVLMVFTDGEPLLAELERDGTLASLAQRPNVRIERIHGASSHTLEPLPLQHAVHETLDRALARRIAAIDSADGADVPRSPSAETPSPEARSARFESSATAP
jgi:pimeloyl-ACP methyl ester carboxylesterase